MNIGMCVRMGSIVLMLGGLFLTGCAPAAQRFVVLVAFNNEAVRDNETGLVWEKSPQATTDRWNNALLACANKTVGNRKGWRLPAIHELASLIDPSVAFPGPTLPPGHPFLNVRSGVYWSASILRDGESLVWFVGFDTGHTGIGPDHKTTAARGWCVRSPFAVFADSLFLRVE